MEGHAVSADRSTPRPIPSLGRIVVGLVVAVLLAVGVGLLIARAAGFAEVADELAGTDASWFVVCLVAQVAALGGYAWVLREGFRWDGGPDPGLGRSAHVVLASLGANRVVAAAGAGGLAVTYWCFRRARFSTREALVRTLGVNTFFYVVFAAGAWGAAAVTATGVWGEAPAGATISWLVVVPACAAAALQVTQPVRVARLTSAAGSFPRRALAYAIAGAAWVRAVLPSDAGRRASLASALYWLGNLLCLWAALQSTGRSLPLPELVLAFATGHVATLLPLPFGGVGGVDAALTYALTLVGVPLAPALVAVAVYRLFAFWVPTIPALVALALLPRAGRGLARVVPEAA